MSEIITHPRHWTGLKLDPFEDLILNEFVHGIQSEKHSRSAGQAQMYSQHFHYFRIHPIQTGCTHPDVL